MITFLETNITYPLPAGTFESMIFLFVEGYIYMDMYGQGDL